MTKVKELRKAYLQGFDDRDTYVSATLQEAIDRAKIVYPNRTKVIPRVVVDEYDSRRTLEWRVIGTELQFRRTLVRSSNDWQSSKRYALMDVTPVRVKMWQDLFDNPTEIIEVEDDEETNE